MQNHRGFSLIEVLVALVVLTTGVTAALSLSARNIDNVYELQNRTLAHWVAQNELVRLSLQPTSINGASTSQTEMAGRIWYLQRKIEPTFDDDIQRLMIQVYADQQRTQRLSQLTGYLPVESSP